MYSLGIDIGSSSVKVSVLDVELGRSVTSAFYPATELEIHTPQPGWAEQDPKVWWQSFLNAFRSALKKSEISAAQIKSIGISYQMHGLVVLNDKHEVLRPSIIWCDSRAVEIGDEAFVRLGAEYCTQNLLNSPGNFTASKLRWIRENEPKIYDQVKYFMLPGDYIAFKLSGEVNTTASGLSEGVLWDFKDRAISQKVLDNYGISGDQVPDIVPTFGLQSTVSETIAAEIGIAKGTPISYRAGDQPNNAFSLNVLNPGEVAATAGTSGVVYAVTDSNVGDPSFRVNTFLHVSDIGSSPRNGVLLCINGTGILNSWLRKTIGHGSLSYDQMDQQATRVGIGSQGLKFFPFGNGAERILKNKYPKATLKGLDLNRHTQKHIFRAGQEGIVFALRYGFDILNEIGVVGKTIRAGRANMFLSPVFREAFVNTVGAKLELYNTDGAEGAARGAAFGAGLYASLADTFSGLACLEYLEPEKNLQLAYEKQYQAWKTELETQLDNLKID